MLVPCGTTEKAATLSDAEHRRVIEITVGWRRQGTAIAGCGSNNTAHAIELTLISEGSGRGRGPATFRLITIVPTKRAFMRFCGDRRCFVDIPLMLIQSVPFTYGDGHLCRDDGRLSRFASVVGVKDATGNLGRVSAQRLACGTRLPPDQRHGRDGAGVQRDGRRRAAFRSAPTSRRVFARTFRRPPAKADGTKRFGFRTGSIRCMPPCSRMLRPGP